MRIWHYVFLAVFLCVSACNLDDDNYYKLVITSFDDTFTAGYTIDSTFYPIEPSEIEVKGAIYTYSKGLGSLTSLEVDVAGKTNTSFLKVALYQNEQLVSSQRAEPGYNDRNLFISFTYTATEAGKN
ncbi:MAG: hypothetical protein FWG92_07610 [Leptospirales bacterium]|nr:hypothetical protein [Leptospirales bacterium]